MKNSLQFDIRVIRLQRHRLCAACKLSGDLWFSIVHVTMRIMLLLLWLLAAQVAAVPLVRHKPNWHMYHTTQQIHERVRALSANKYMHVSQLTQTLAAATNTSHTDLQLVELAAPDGEDASNERINILVIAGEHGREMITSEIVLHLLEYVDHLTPTSKDEDSEPQWLAELLAKARIFIVPVVNPWSRVQMEQKLSCGRKNHHNVDLNRNWETRFTKPDAPPQQVQMMEENDDEYPGPSPFSEIETQAVRDLAKRYPPQLYINLHSGATEMYVGWDHARELVPNADKPLKLLEHLSRRYCKCRYGGAAQLGAYVAFGTSTEYMFDTIQTPYAYTIEVFGGKGSMEDCFGFFNPVDWANYNRTIDNWVRTVLTAAAHVSGVVNLEDNPFTLASIWENRDADKAGQPLQKRAHLAPTIDTVAVISAAEQPSVYVSRRMLIAEAAVVLLTITTGVVAVACRCLRPKRRRSAVLPPSIVVARP